MKGSRAYACISLLFILAIMILSPVGMASNSSKISQDIPYPIATMDTAGTFTMENMWDDIFATVSQSHIRNIVEELSTTYAQRVWFPLDRNGSVPLINAWSYVNNSLKSDTGNDLHFTFRTSMLTLVAIQEGTDNSLAPIIIGGVISSRYSPGANGFASSAAAVLECARILHNYNLTNDVYYVLSNSISDGYFNYDTGNHGLEAIMNEMYDEGIIPSAVLWFNRLLYTTTDSYGSAVRVDYDYIANPYDPVRFITDLSDLISEKSGTNQIVIPERTTDQVWRASGAYEAWHRGIPGVAIGQYYPDTIWRGENDIYDSSFYDYGNAREAVGVIASIVATACTLGKGDAPYLRFTGSLDANSTTQIPMSLTGNSFVNVTVNWNNDTSLIAQILDPDVDSVYFRNESDMTIHLNYLVTQPGRYTLLLDNLANESIIYSVEYAHYHDLDGDTLDDYEEFLAGTDAISSDTDRDFLTDDQEIAYNTDPRNQDSDQDGAFDGIEVALGSNPLVQDSDLDSLFDGFEIDNGLNPMSADTDQDGLDDAFELNLGLSPLSADTDADGLDDYSEYEIGTNPLSPDSDGDGLSDLFEVLNALDPLAVDSDSDGLSDPYEIEHCLMPFDADTDRDGIIDSVDGAPREHWANVLPFIGLGVFSIVVLGILLSKRRAYNRSGIEMSDYAKNNAFNLRKKRGISMRGSGFKIFSFMIIGTLLLMPVLASSTNTTVLSETTIAPVPTNTLSDIEYLNASELFEDIWSAVSEDNLRDLVQDLTETYPNRIWTTNGPNENLTGSWGWANTTLKTNTENELAFQQITDYQNLLAIKTGSGISPRPAIVISGVIDTEHSPGANDAGASVAAVLEIARVLHNYTFSYDVYYVLINGMHLDDNRDLGSQAFVQWLEENEIETLTNIAFDRLLFHHSGFLYGTQISIRSDSATGLYHDESWIPELMSQLSKLYGNGWIKRVSDMAIADRSCAKEMWRVGRQGMHISQGFQYDIQSSTQADTWDNSYYSFEKTAETAAATAAVTAYIGIIGKGLVPERTLNGVLNVSESAFLRTMVSSSGFLNSTITWDQNVAMKGTMMNASYIPQYQRIEDDGILVMKYLPSRYGTYILNITNLGGILTNFTVSVVSYSDIDGDTINDFEEIALGTSPYLRDSDRDGLSDNFEISLGTNPTNRDTDGDGASDYDEYTWDSSLLSSDSDGDQIDDGTEAALGTDPTSIDSDQDGLNDYLEVYEIGTNPLSVDSDLDGLEDGFEYEMGLNPLSPDTDGDSLSDLFEILNQLSPFVRDTDGDGWSDAYEVEYCMNPTNADTDSDGIPDGTDWDPREHWISVVSPVSLLSVVMLIVIYSFLKLRLYRNE
ncbi:MAG: M28 family peptidase [Candidatus Thorarchaeota archaeon]|nr:M28 family peptidase [Candidatus Thorarchaeota archaeon]